MPDRGGDAMSLGTVKDTYEKLGHEDPLYAVLSDKRRRHNRWEPEEFFRTGTREIRAVLQYVEGLGVELGREAALDFGCGVGRLSRALAEQFHGVVGVDISASMIRNAREYDRSGGRIEYLVNATDDLQILDADRFDFVYSNMTLQHIPPQSAARYIGEFFRVLRPGGLAIFQVPDGRPYRAGSMAAWVYTLRRRHIRRLWKRLRGQPPVEVHYIARSQVEQLVAESGGRVIDVVGVGRKRRKAENFRYCATK